MADSAPLRCSVHHGDGVTEIELDGEMDLSAVDTVRDVLKEAIASGVPRVEIAAAKLTYLDSSGINCLVRAATDAEEAGVELVMRDPTPVVRRVLEITRVDDVLLEGPRNDTSPDEA